LKRARMSARTDSERFRFQPTRRGQAVPISCAGELLARGGECSRRHCPAPAWCTREPPARSSRWRPEQRSSTRGGPAGRPFPGSGAVDSPRGHKPGSHLGANAQLPSLVLPRDQGLIARAVKRTGTPPCHAAACAQRGADCGHAFCFVFEALATLARRPRAAASPRKSRPPRDLRATLSSAGARPPPAARRAAPGQPREAHAKAG
jgi:hypothetical protein